MATYSSNYELAQEISARLGTEPIPFESVLSLCHEIYTELGGDEEQFDNVYEILLEILPLARQHNVIDDTVTSTTKTWSSNKINTELSGKQNTLVAGSGITISGDTISAEGKSYNAGTNITIDSANTISADGYVFDKTKHAFRTDSDTVNGSGANVATGINSFSCGDKSTASGDYGSFAAGSETVASGWCAFAEGNQTLASGDYSHAEGGWTHAEGLGSHSEGVEAYATGIASHAEGWGGQASNKHNLAAGDGSHVEGCITNTKNKGEHAEGTCNVSHKNSNNDGDSGNTLSSIGCGIYTNERKNAREIMQNADMYIYGIGGYDGVHIKGENTGITVQTVQEVINSKQGTLTAGTNITIDSANTISAKGYTFNGDTNGGFAEKYKQDNSDGGQIVANTATGLGSHAEGYNTTASGDYGSHAEGNVSVASGYVSHAEGNRCTASGIAAHAEGNKTTASGDDSHTEGTSTTASGNNSHAEGLWTYASGYFSHAEGQGSSNVKNTASGKGSHVEGSFNTAQNFSEHAEGAANVSHRTEIDDENHFGNSGNTIHSIGIGRYANTRKNAIEVMQNADMYIKGVGNYDGVHIKGEVSGTTVQTVQEVINNKQDTLTAGQNITIDSANTISADGYVWNDTYGSLATIYRNPDNVGQIATNVASSYGAHAEGIETTASNEGSHAEGAWGTVASGKYSHAEGGATTATGSGSHAEGQQTTASGKFSHAEGNQTIASGQGAHAEGGKLKNCNPTTASGNAAHAEGQSTSALGQSSHAEGEGTEAKNGSEHAEGNCNVSHQLSNNYGESGNTLSSIGIGYFLNYVPQRKNAVEVMQNGDMYLYGVGNYDGVHIKGEVSGTTVQTVQEVINSKANAYETATTAEIEALFA